MSLLAADMYCWGGLNGLLNCHCLDISFGMKRLQRDFTTVGLRFEEGIDAPWWYAGFWISQYFAEGGVFYVVLGAPGSLGLPCPFWEG